MPTYQFEAMDSTGQEIKDVIEAPNEAEAQATIRQMGYFVTKIAVKKARKTAAEEPSRAAKRTAVRPGRRQSRRSASVFTRQLSILQDAGLPILRSLRILEEPVQAGPFKNCLMDVCDEIEGGATLSEAMAKSPKAFDRLYVNMIKAGEAGGALEVILRRLAEFQERAQSLKRKVKGAMVYPVVVVHGGRRHLDVHHDQDRAGVREDLQRLQARTAADDQDADRHSRMPLRLLVLHSRPSRSASGCSSSCCANSATAAKGGTRSRSKCPSSASWSRKTFWPAPRARSARSSPAACRFSRP